jgi:hypothetical protein
MSRVAGPENLRGTATKGKLPTQTLFAVQPEDLARLDAQEAVALFRDLLWAEARTIGLPTSNVRVSELINVPDGGIYAMVEGGLPEGADLIREGRTGYQIKASSAFRPWQLSATNTMFGRLSVWVSAG